MNMNTISPFINILKNSTYEQEINYVTQQATSIYKNAAKFLTHKIITTKIKKQVTPRNNNNKMV